MSMSLNPVTSVAWLANKLGEFGVAFEPGHVILTGSFVRAFPVKAIGEPLCGSPFSFRPTAYRRSASCRAGRLP